MELEAPMLHLPFKRLKNLFSTTTRAIEKDIQAIVLKIRSLGDRKTTITAAEATEELSGLVNKLESLQRKLEETNRQEQLLADHLRSRIETSTLSPTRHYCKNDIALKLWYRHQTDRLIVDYFVRQGEYELAASFSLESNLSDFEDVDLFVGKVKPVVEALRLGDCKEVNKWMHSNQSKLKKLDTNLVARFELELRLQDFFSMMQSGKSGEAIAFAQETFLAFTAMGEYFASRVKHAMSTLVFLGMKDSPLSQEFTGSQRWDFLIREFHKLFFHLYGLSNEPLLSIATLAGLQATVTPNCIRFATSNPSSAMSNGFTNGVGSSSSNEGHAGSSNGTSHFTNGSSNGVSLNSSNGNGILQPIPTSSSLAAHTNCPACAAPFRAVLSQIPLPHRPTSSLVCPLTHAPIDESNYPMALPNGTVYSKKAVELHSVANSFTDPRSGTSYEISSIRRVFIM